MLKEARERSVRYAVKASIARNSVPRWTSARFEKNLSTLSKNERNESPSAAAGVTAPVLLVRPEVWDGFCVGARVGDPVRNDDDHRVLIGVVPDRPDDVRGDLDDCPGSEVEHLILELELQRSLRDEVDLLGVAVAVAVGALAARLRRHPPPCERDLLGVELVGHHPHLARIVAEDIGRFLQTLDHVVGHGAILSVLLGLPPCQRLRSRSAAAPWPSPAEPAGSAWRPRRQSQSAARESRSVTSMATSLASKRPRCPALARTPATASTS